MVRRAHHERNQQLTVRPEPVEGLVQCFLNMQRRERASVLSLKFAAQMVAISTRLPNFLARLSRRETRRDRVGHPSRSATKYRQAGEEILQAISDSGH